MTLIATPKEQLIPDYFTLFIHGYFCVKEGCKF